jgi:hypothetical protein
LCFAKELGRARFTALKKSHGEFLLALDSDQFLGKHTIKKCVKKMQTNKYDALILNEESVVRYNTFIEKTLAYDKWLVNSAKDLNPVLGASIPRFFKREMLLKAKWPKTVSILDDAILHNNFTKINYSVGFVSGNCIKHYEVNSWIVLFKKFIRYGKLYVPTMRVSSNTTLLHSLPRRSYINARVFKKPHLVGGLILLYIVKASAVLTGIGIFFLQKLMRSIKL